MITDRIKELNATKAKLVALESSIAVERTAALAALPSQYGFTEVGAFVSAVRAAADKRRGGKSKVSTSSKAKVVKIRRKRAVITDATRGEVKKLVEAGETGNEIAKILKISLPSVQNIKKALGLVKKPKK